MSRWERVPLGSLCTFQRGLTYSKSDEVDYSNNGVLRANNVDLATNQLNLRDIRYISDAINVPASKKVRHGTLLICTASGSRSHLGKVALIEEHHDLAFGGFMGLIVPGALIESRYLYYVLTSEQFQDKLNSLAGGTNINNLKFKDISDYEVPLPPVEEQRRIVAVLVEAFSAIATATANAEKNLANAHELFQRSLAEVFEPCSAKWVVEPLKTNVRFIDYRGKTPPKRATGVRLITAKNVKMGFIQRSPEEFIDPAAYDGWMTRGFPKPGDVLFTTEAPLGNVAQLDTNERVVIGQRLITMQPTDRIDRTFLKYALCSAPLQRSILEQATGATVSGIKAKLLKEISIFYPASIHEQRRIVERLDELYRLSQALADRAESKLAYLIALKQSLLLRAFIGELNLDDTTVSKPANDNFATPAFAAQILAFAHSRHVALGRSGNFGHVKAQKTLHSVEAIGGLELGRRPIKDAAGPNDFAHMRRAEEWAKQQGFFEFVPRPAGGYDFRQLKNYDRLLNDAKSKMDQSGTAVKRTVELLVDMDSDWAEIVVTTHAAWNNLILDNVAVTDDAVVFAARDDWHRAKLRHDKSRFHDAIRFIRSHGIEPDGSTKRVGGQASLQF